MSIDKPAAGWQDWRALETLASMEFKPERRGTGSKRGWIYKIECLQNRWLYIGQTRNGMRFASHKTELRRGTHTNRPLQKDWNLYGEENFKFEILEEHIDLPYQGFDTLDLWLIERENQILGTCDHAYNRSFLVARSRLLISLQGFTGDNSFHAAIATREYRLVSSKTFETLLERLQWLESKVDAIDKRTRKQKQRLDGIQLSLLDNDAQSVKPTPDSPENCC